jgi:hypothetical protein
MDYILEIILVQSDSHKGCPVVQLPEDEETDSPENHEILNFQRYLIDSLFDRNCYPKRLRSGSIPQKAE